jgi:hypothetical protein
MDEDVIWDKAGGVIPLTYQRPEEDTAKCEVSDRFSSRLNAFTSQVASAVRAAAIPALEGWSTRLTLRSPLPSSEVVETVEVSICPMRPEVVGELVRLDLDILVGVPFGGDVVKLIQMELRPFIIGVGAVAVEDCPEGLVVLRRDMNREEKGHWCSPVREMDNCPAITPVMIEAAAEVLWRYPLLDIPTGLAESLAREMLRSALSVSPEIPEVVE